MTWLEDLGHGAKSYEVQPGESLDPASTGGTEQDGAKNRQLREPDVILGSRQGMNTAPPTYCCRNLDNLPDLCVPQFPLLQHVDKSCAYLLVFLPFNY